MYKYKKSCKRVCVCTCVLTAYVFPWQQLETNGAINNILQIILTNPLLF